MILRVIRRDSSSIWKSRKTSSIELNHNLLKDLRISTDINPLPPTQTELEPPISLILISLLTSEARETNHPINSHLMPQELAETLPTTASCPPRPRRLEPNLPKDSLISMLESSPTESLKANSSSFNGSSV